MRLSGPFTSALLLAATLAAGASPDRAAAQSAGSVLDRPEIAPVRDRVEAHVEQARQASLPDAWLTDKVAEGLAKHVPPPLIARAVEGLWGRMQTGSALLAHINPQWRTDRDLLRGAVDALAVGAPRAELRALGQKVVEGGPAPDRARRRMRETLVAVAEIGERGFSGELAAQAVHRAFSRHGLRGVASLVRRLRELPANASPSRRRQALRRAADQAPSGHAYGHDKAGDRPDERGGPSSDDSRGQGQRREPDRPAPPTKGRR